ncbi:MAG: hypothetical protein ABIC40_08380 [bacterium]
MKTWSILGFVLGVSALLCSPANASPQRDYIQDQLDKWVNYAEDLGYEVMETEIGTISDKRSFTYSLPDGTYHVYAEGGMGVRDLDLLVYNGRGHEIDSDTMADTYPVVNFSLRGDEETELELEATRFERHASRGYFCLVLAREDERRFRSERGHGNYRDADRGRGRGNYPLRRHYRDNGNDYWDSWFDRDSVSTYNWSNYWKQWDGEWSDWSRWHNDWNNRSDSEWDDNWDHWDNWDSDRYNPDQISDREGRIISDSRLDFLYRMAYRRHLYPVMDDSGPIRNKETLRITLPAGRYAVFATADSRVSDLDISVVDGEGWTIVDDFDMDASPAVWFNLPERTRVNIEVKVWSFEGFNSSAYYSLLLCEDNR